MKNKILLILLAALSLLTCCSPEDKEIILTVDPDSLSFENGNIEMVSIISNGKWKVELIGASWCSIDKTEGDGNGEVQVTLKRTTLEKLQGVLKITSLDDISLCREVRLVVGDLVLDVTPRSVGFNAVGSSEFEVDIICEGKWTAELLDDSWCRIDKTSGMGDGKIKISLTDRENTANRATGLVIRPEDYPDVSCVVTVRYNNAFAHGKCVVLNKAEVGLGIDIVLLGEGFTLNDLQQGGRWQQAMKIACDSIFRYEPFKSYRDHFNLYAVAAPCAENLNLWDFTGEIRTDLGTYTPEKADFSVDNYTAMFNYAYSNTPVKEDKGEMKNMLVAFLINTDKTTGYTDWCVGNHIDKREYWGMAIAPVGIFSNYSTTCYFTHELLGHGFSAFHEEYSLWNPDGNLFPLEDIASNRELQREGINQNVEFTSDPDEFVNQNWAALYKMGYPEVSIEEGGALYLEGVWRSSFSSCMRQTYAYISPVQREIHLRRIYKLSGRESEYSLEVFLEYDKRNSR